MLNDYIMRYTYCCVIESISSIVRCVLCASLTPCRKKPLYPCYLFRIYSIHTAARLFGIFHVGQFAHFIGRCPVVSIYALRLSVNAMTSCGSCGLVSNVRNATHPLLILSYLMMLTFLYTYSSEDHHSINALRLSAPAPDFELRFRHVITLCGDGIWGTWR